MADVDTTGSTWYRLDKSPTEVYEEQMRGRTPEQFFRDELKKRKAPSEKRPSNYQDVQDEKTRRKEEAAPTTKTEMGKTFKKGGSIKGWGKARGARKCKVC